MATYIPNATQTTEPVESRTVESAALEFRTLKASINGRIEDVQDNLDAEIVNRIAADAAETAARIAGDTNLQTQNNAQDVRLQAIEAALLAIGEGGLPGTVYVQRLSGTGAQTAFTLNVSVPTSALIDVFINGVYQNKDTFTISGTSLTFSEAPPAGTDNIEVVVSITIANVETDASLVSFRATDSTTVVRTVQDKLREWVSVKDFGGVGDGVANDAPAALAMGAAVGFIRFTHGAYLCNTATFDYPMLFDLGAYITVPTGNVLTIFKPIDAPRQWIFRGDGTVNLRHDTATGGENTRHIHAAWFGAFPLSASTADQAPALNRALAAMGNFRESIIELDVGNYSISSQLVMTRGAWLKGAGARRTVLRCDADGFDAVVTNNVACKISDLGFEIHSSMTDRSNAYVSVLHDDFEMYDVNMGQTQLGIVINAINARIMNMKAAYAAAKPAGSSLVKIIGGANHVVDGLYLTSSSGFGPAAIVDIDSSASVSNVEVSDITTISPACCVRVSASGGNVGQVLINGIKYSGFAGTPPQNIIHLVTSGAHNLNDVVIDGVLGNSHLVNGIRLEQNSTGTMEDISIDSVIIGGTTGNGIEFIRTAGTLKDVLIGGSVDVSERATPFFYSGASSGIKISPTAMPAALPAYCYDLSLSNGTAAQIALNKSVFTGWLMVSVGTAERGMYVIRAASSPTAFAYGSPTANMATATTALTGTTGVDGKFTVGVTNGVLYFENRLGSTQRVTAVVMTGVM